MALSKRDKRAVTVGAVLLGALLIVQFGALPWVQHWRHVRSQAAEARAHLVSLGRQWDRLQRQSRHLQAAYGKALDRPLDDVESTRLAFHKTVQDVLKAGGLAFDRFDFQTVRPLKKVPGVMLVPVQVRGKCKIGQLAKCLLEMRQAPMLIIVDRISIKSNPKKPAELNVTLVLATLAQQPQKAQKADQAETRS